MHAHIGLMKDDTNQEVIKFFFLPSLFVHTIDTRDTTNKTNISQPNLPTATKPTNPHRPPTDNSTPQPPPLRQNFKSTANIV